MKEQTTWKQLVVIAIAIVIGLAVSSPAKAASILSNLDPAGVTHLEDNDWEFIHGNTNTLLEQGEFLVGMIQIQKVNHTSSAFTFTPTAGTDSTLTAVFALEVTSVTDAGIGLTGPCGQRFCYTFGAPDAAEYAVLAAAYGLDPRVSVNTVAIVYNDSSNPYVDPAAAGKIAALDTAQDGTEVWEFGLLAGDFWTANLNTNDITLINPTVSGFGASGSVTHYYPGAPQLDPHNFLIPTAFGDYQLKGGFEPLTGNAGNNFQAQTDTDIYILTVPEPTSLILLGVGMLMVFPVSRYLSRRRKK